MFEALNLQQLYDYFSANPVLLAFVIAATTLLWEDGIVVFVAALVTSGEVNWMVAFAGLALGIAAGDIILYFLGRFAVDLMLRFKWISPERLARYETRLGNHLAKTVFLARFIPGTRTPTFLVIGLLKAPFPRFALLAFAASTLQALLVSTLSHFLGETAQGLVTNRYVKIALGAVLVIAILAIRYNIARRRKKREAADGTPPLVLTETPHSPFEFWPPFLFYLPAFLHGLWLVLRHRSLRLPFNSNPAIHVSGFAGESKTDVYKLLAASPECDKILAPVASLPPRHGATPDARLDDARIALARAPFAFPCVAKPDIGQRGAGIRRVHNFDELRDYLSRYPSSEPLLLQQLVTLPHEAAILCHRLPKSPNTVHVTSLVIKEIPTLIGDGAHTVRQLIIADSRLRKLSKIFFEKQAAILGTVPPPGARIPLTFTGNHAQGAIFWDRSHQITPALAARFSDLARSLPGVFYMRFDIRYRDFDALLRGEDFILLELNGAGAEPAHLYDPRRTWSEARAILRWQYATLFKIGRQNLRLGVNAMPPLREIWRSIQRARRLPKSYPPAE